MYLAQLRHVFVHKGLRLGGIAAQHLDVRPHRDRLAEHEDELALPEKPFHERPCLRNVVAALLCLLVLRVVRDFLGETEQELHVLHCHRAPGLS